METRGMITLHYPAANRSARGLMALLAGLLVLGWPGARARGATDEEAPMPRDEYVVEVREVKTQATAVIRFRVPQEEIGTKLAEVLPAVYAYVTAQGVTPGTPFSRYFGTEAGLVDMEAGLRVAQPVSGEGEIRPGELPGCRVASTWHAGPYEELPAAHRALEAWVEAHAEVPAGGVWELYVTDPGREPDPAKWRTRVELPLAPVGKP